VRVIVVGGAGAMGQVTVRDLARSAGVERVTVADLDGARASAVAAEARTAPGARAAVEGVAASITDRSFPSVLEGHDVCIASTNYRLNPVIAEACLTAGCGYVDLGGLFHVARQTLEYDGRFKDAGLTGITCMGGAPGITNMLAAGAVRSLDTVRAIHVRLGAWDPSVEGLPLPVPYSLETLLDEFSLPAMAYREGGFVEVPPLGEPEEVDFPYPIGSREVHTTLHSEVATLPRAFPQVEDVTFKISFPDGFVERFRLLAAVGLAGTDPIEVDDALIRPRDVLIALARRLPQAEGVDDVECLRVVVEGSRDGTAATVVAESVVEPDRAWGVGGGGRDTGIPPSVVAQMIGHGEVKGPGMFAPEEVLDPDAFFAQLAERGITNTIAVS
jgi:lysine 6-dehydrogenase